MFRVLFWTEEQQRIRTRRISRPLRLHCTAESCLVWFVGSQPPTAEDFIWRQVSRLRCAIKLETFCQLATTKCRARLFESRNSVRGELDGQDVQDLVVERVSPPVVPSTSCCARVDTTNPATRPPGHPARFQLAMAFPKKIAHVLYCCVSSYLPS